jgi:hypothetical protein
LAQEEKTDSQVFKDKRVIKDQLASLDIQVRLDRKVRQDQWASVVETGRKVTLASRVRLAIEVLGEQGVVVVLEVNLASKDPMGLKVNRGLRDWWGRQESRASRVCRGHQVSMVLLEILVYLARMVYPAILVTEAKLECLDLLVNLVPSVKLDHQDLLESQVRLESVVSQACKGPQERGVCLERQAKRELLAYQVPRALLEDQDHRVPEALTGKEVYLALLVRMVKKELLDHQDLQAELVIKAHGEIQAPQASRDHLAVQAKEGRQVCQE